MAGNSATAARNAIPIEIASAGPALVNAGRRVNTMPQKVMATVAADAAMTLPMERNPCCHSPVGVCAGPDVLVVAADQEDGIVGAGADDHRRHQRDGQRGHPKSELSQRGHDTLGRHHRNSDGDQRQQHGHESSVDHQQDNQHQQCGGNLDPVHVAIADDRQVADHGRLSGHVRDQRGARGGAFGDFCDPLVGPQGSGEPAGARRFTAM